MNKTAALSATKGLFAYILGLVAFLAIIAVAFVWVVHSPISFVIGVFAAIAFVIWRALYDDAKRYG